MRVENQGTVQTGSRQVQKQAELGKDAFMSILVAQLQHQDPLRPMDDREFISQMAQFTALEQMQNLNSEFTQLKAIDMLGKHIIAELREEGKEPELISGIAESAGFVDGRINIVVGGRSVPIEDILNIQMQPQTSV